MTMKKLMRSKRNRIIAGVCGGIGEYLDVDPTVIRVVWVVLTIISVGAGILAYIAAWLIIPEEETPVESAANVAEPAPSVEEKGT
jgi:phage shock protein C